MARTGETPARHRASRLVAVLIAGALPLAACDSGTGAGEKGTIRTAPPTAPSASGVPVPDLVPTDPGPCPYLTAEEASDLNGEKIVDVKTDHQVDPPGCFFSTYGNKIAMVTSVFTVESEQRARELVDRTAPPARTERADVAGGWTGGKSGGPGGAMLAVAKGPRVVVVQSRQEQSIKVQRVADLVIPRLG